VPSGVQRQDTYIDKFELKAYIENRVVSTGTHEQVMRHQVK